MSSRCPRLAVLALAACAAAVHAADLRVCADPDNLPFSHRDGSGFENRIASLVAAELGAAPAYTWLPQRRGFVRRTLNADACDVVIGVPAGYEPVRTTAPYYRSMYVFVQRAARSPIRSFDELDRAKRIGVQLVGDDLAATPPGHALAARGLVDNVAGFLVYGEQPQVERMVRAVAEGALDVAIAWGPPAAYFAARAAVPLVVTVAAPPVGFDAAPFAYDIAMGVRTRDGALAERLDAVIARRRDDITAVLRAYGVPLAADGAAP